MKVLKFTHLVSLKQRALNQVSDDAAGKIADALKAQGEDIPVKAIEGGLFEYIVLSTRLDLALHEADFELASASDDAETLAVKYLKYLSSEYSDLIVRVWAEITNLDSRVETDSDLAPLPPAHASPKK